MDEDGGGGGGGAQTRPPRRQPRWGWPVKGRCLTQQQQQQLQPLLLLGLPRGGPRWPGPRLEKGD